jgi:hypothetical protein
VLKNAHGSHAKGVLVIFFSFSRLFEKSAEAHASRLRKDLNEFARHLYCSRLPTKTSISRVKVERKPVEIWRKNNTLEADLMAPERGHAAVGSNKRFTTDPSELAKLGLFTAFVQVSTSFAFHSNCPDCVRTGSEIALY